MVDKILRILPVKTWTLEVNRFAFMKMEDGNIRGMDFQNGRMKGYSSVEDYVFNLQDGRCACCGKKIDRRGMKFHHIVERHNGGSDGPENRAGLCEDCHVKIHQGFKETIAQLKKIGQKKKYAALSVLNQAIPYIYDGLVDRLGVENVFLCTGQETAAMRDAYGLTKEHYTDAMCIASIGAGAVPCDDGCHIYGVKQFRRHDRAIINNQRERTYKLDGKVVAKNRKPRFEQNGPSLKDYLEMLPASERRLVCSQLAVTKSKRLYNNTEREHLPGCIIMHNGKRYVMSGQSNTGGYYTAVSVDGRIPISKCRVIKTGGLVYVE